MSRHNRVFHNHTKLAMLALMPTLYPHIFVVSSLFASTAVSKCEIRIQGVQDTYISRLLLYWSSF